MEKGTVTLSLREYNQLRDFMTEIKKGKTVFYFSDYCSNAIHQGQFVTENTAVKIIAEENAGLTKTINKQTIELAGSKPPTTIEDVSIMSIWQFIKWRKK